MLRSTRHFPLNLADPRTHGWGGAYLDPSHFTIWLFISMMVMPPLLYEKASGRFWPPQQDGCCYCGAASVLSSTCAASPITTRSSFPDRVSFATRAASPCTAPLAASVINGTGRRLPACAISAACCWNRGKVRRSATAAACWNMPITSTSSPRRGLICAVPCHRSSPSSCRRGLSTVGMSCATAITTSPIGCCY